MVDRAHPLLHLPRIRKHDRRALHRQRALEAAWAGVTLLEARVEAREEVPLRLEHPVAGLPQGRGAKGTSPAPGPRAAPCAAPVRLGSFGVPQPLTAREDD